MTNPYEAPKSNLDSNDENNSGQGKVEKLPDGVAERFYLTGYGLSAIIHG
jgi:hypothetical protein